MSAPAGPGCGHADCLFAGVCLIVAAELELADAIADNERRREQAEDLLLAIGAPLDLVPLLLVALHSPSMNTRVRACDLLLAEVVRAGEGRAA